MVAKDTNRNGSDEYVEYPQMAISGDRLHAFWLADGQIWYRPGTLNISNSRDIGEMETLPLIRPNPVQDNFVILLPPGNEPYTLRLFDTNSKLMVTYNDVPAGQAFRCNIANLTTGLYQIEVRNANGYLKVQKLIKH